MTSVEVIKAKRTTIRKLTTQLINQIDGKLKSDDIDEQELRDDYELLIERANELKELDSEIEKSIDIENIDKEITACQDYKAKCLKYSKRIARYLQSKSKVTVSEPPNQSISSVFSENIRHQSSVKLPKLVIEHYSGDPKLWTNFWNSFESTIDKNEDISKVEKFAYLKSFLTGQAANVVSGFELSSENYDNCIKALKSRFGKRDVIINSFMNKILNLEEVKNSSNVQALRRVYDELDISIRNLEAMNVTSNSFGHLLMPILQKILPQDLILEFNRKKDEDDYDISKFITFLKKEVECRETTLLACGENRSFSNNQKFVNKRCNRNIPTASAFNATVNRSCIFCQKLHDYFKCNKRVADKINILKAENRCFKCFKKFHLSRFCRDKGICTKCNSKTHHESICMRNNEEGANKSGQNTSENALIAVSSNNEHSTEKVSTNAFVSYCNMPNTKNTLLQTCTVLACTDNETKVTRVILDQGSERCFIKDTLAKSLKLQPIRNERLSVFAFGTEKPIIKNYPVVVIELRDKKQKNKIKIECLVTNTIAGCPIRSPSAKSLEKMKYLGLESADLSINNEELQHVGILIGADRFWDIVLTARKRISKELQAVNTIFGWLLVGIERNKSNRDSNQLAIMVGNTMVLDDLRVFWELDSLGINEECDKHSQNNDEIISCFEENLQFKNGRYECKLLWKSNTDGLRNNFDVAKRRFESLKYKLYKNPEILQKYKAIIEEQLKEKIVENCSVEVKDSDYYMPHRAVIRSSETTSVRIVFDASSKDEGSRSLNECLETGPNLNPNILDIILRFREPQIAFSGDIEKAFLMIGIAEDDRDFLRFLWFGDDNEKFKILRMCRAPFGTAISPFILAATIKCHIKKYKDTNPESFEMLNTSMYVDDLFYGGRTVEDAYRLSVDAIKILRDAGMNLRKLTSNSDELNSLWVKENLKGDENLNKQTKFLGMIWNPTDDSIKINLEPIFQSVDNNDVTKRHILKTVAKLFDPLGYLQPLVVRIKILLQDIWLLGLDWDENLPPEMAKRWGNWVSEIKCLENLTFPRKLFVEATYSKPTVHIFCDATPRAFGAVAYFRYVDHNNKAKSTFIIAKSRIAPLKALSLPRCELMGAVVAARLAKYLKRLLPKLTERLYFWCDSTITLCWIKKSPNEWKPFVSNRVAEIQSISSPNQWYYCSGKENPADIISRGVRAETILSNPLWLNGPSWLTENENLWPQKINIEADEEVIAVEKKKALTILQTVTANDSDQNSNSLLDLTKYSKLNKVYRITAWIFRFIKNSKPGCEKLYGPLTASEIMIAERYWVKDTQRKYFKKEITDLSKGKSIEKMSSIYSLNPELDDYGILRLKGRLEFADCSESAKHPWLLPSKCQFVQLLITAAHERVLHAGVDSTLNHLRDKFWIIKGRQRVKAILHKCTTCKRFSAQPGVQDMAPLPPDRIIESPPFAVTGLDFAGPFFTRENSEKHYLLIFTCAVTRAVHLEIVPSMHTEHFLLAFRRFISRRGLCSTIYSDNAKSFKRADFELKKLWKNINDPSVKDLFSSHNIKWKYIVEKGAWWGGFWERMIRTIKTTLRKIVGRSSLSLNELETIFVEIEAMINSRPITYLYSDPSEPTPLTPSHFLIGKRLLSLPSTKISKEDLSGSRKTIIKKYKHQQIILNHFWKSWKNSYLLLLKSANICQQKSNIKEFQPNDIVLIGDDRYPRNMWSLGRVIDIFPGRDGKVRSCSIKTQTGIIRRPVQLIYNLELND